MTRLTSWKVGGPTDPSIEIDAAVKVETADHKFRDTMVALEGPSGHHRLWLDASRKKSERHSITLCNLSGHRSVNHRVSLFIRVPNRIRSLYAG